MHISFLTSRFLPEHTGGSETYTYNIAKALQRKGHEVSVLYAPVWVLPQRQKSYQVTVEDDIYDGIPVRRLCFDWQSAPDRHGYLFLHNPLVESHIADWLTLQRADITHVTSCIHLSTSTISASIAQQIPVVLTFTQYWPICPRTTLERKPGVFCTGRQDGPTCLECLYGKTRPLRLLSKLPARLRSSILDFGREHPQLTSWNSSLNLISAVDRRNVALPYFLKRIYLISPSRFLADRLSQSGLVERGCIHYSPHGHDVQRAQVGSQKSHSCQVRFGFTGNVIPIKGVTLLVSAFNRLDCADRARLVIYGDTRSAYGEQVKALAANNPAIEFRGRFDNKDIGRILQDIDVVVVPSTCYENAPVTIAEAFAAQTPVIATDLGGMAEAIRTGIDGLLFRVNDVDDLVSKMEAVISDASLLTRLRSSITPVRSVDDEALHLLDVYGQLRASRLAI